MSPQQGPIEPSDFDQTIPSENEPFLDLPIVHVKDLANESSAEALKNGMELGIFWLDPGEEHRVLKNLDTLWDDVNATLDTAKTSPRWKHHRFQAPQDVYLDALMWSVHGAGSHYFCRPSFETSTTMPVRAQACAPHLYHDIAKRLKDVRELGTDLSEKVFYKMNHLLGIEDGYLEGGCDRLYPITLHRVTPVQEDDQKKVAAQEHFDFNLCNVLLYNYVQGFKIYQDGFWYQIAEPPRQGMFLFNLGSVLSVRSSRRITALFHRVDTPVGRMGPRLSVVCPVAPALHETIRPHPNLVRPGDPKFDPHSFRDHVFYASKNYTKLRKHTVFAEAKQNEQRGIHFHFRQTACTAIKTRLRYLVWKAKPELSYQKNRRIGDGEKHHSTTSVIR